MGESLCLYDREYSLIKHGMSFHLLDLLLCLPESFHNFHNLCLNSFVGFLLSYLMNFFATRLLLVNTNVTEFALILSPATLLNLLSGSNGLLVEALGFSMF